MFSSMINHLLMLVKNCKSLNLKCSRKLICFLIVCNGAIFLQITYLGLIKRNWIQHIIYRIGYILELPNKIQNKFFSHQTLCTLYVPEEVNWNCALHDPVLLTLVAYFKMSILVWPIIWDGLSCRKIGKRKSAKRK